MAIVASKGRKYLSADALVGLVRNGFATIPDYRLSDADISLTAIPVKRDKLPSIAYSEELIFSLSVTLQSTDRRHGIVGQERCHFQCDS
jgi:hypothetical protein